jgi:hypothetical protein
VSGGLSLFQGQLDEPGTACGAERALYADRGSEIESAVTAGSRLDSKVMPA